MKYKLKELSKGDGVTVDGNIKGVIDSVESDIKNGLPGINYTSENKKKSFCYLEQITDLTKKVKALKTISQTISYPEFTDLDIGDIVVVNVIGGGQRTGIIEDVIQEIKNGMDGISYNCEKEGSCWAYANQIELLTKQESATRAKSRKKM